MDQCFLVPGGAKKKCIGTLMTDQFNSVSIGRKVSGKGLYMDTGPVLYFQLTF